MREQEKYKELGEKTGEVKGGEETEEWGIRR